MLPFSQVSPQTAWQLFQHVLHIKSGLLESSFAFILINYVMFFYIFFFF